MTNLAAMNNRDWITLALNSGRRSALLAHLAWDLVIANRGVYPAPETETYQRVSPWIGANEALHPLTNQLRSDFDHGRSGYPDRALVESMFSAARAWHWDEPLRAAVQAALANTANAALAPYVDANGSSDLIEAALSILQSDRRQAFLTELFYQMMAAVRSIRLPSERDREVIARFACHNDLLLRIAGQMRDGLILPSSRHDGRQDVEALIAAANAGGCGGSLRGVVERVFQSATAMS